MNEGTGGGLRPGRLAAVLARAALLAGAALLATACGGAHPAGSSASPAPGNVQQLDVFAACMRGHGVLNFYFSNSPHTSNTSNELSVMGHYVPGVNPQTAQFGAAMKACKHLLPGGGPGQMTRQQINQMVKFAACMRAHGFPDYPDPVVQNGRVDEQPLPSSIDTSSAQFEQAEQTCGNS
jgi:hypothetical protein